MVFEITIAIYVKATDVIEVYAPSHHYTLDANSAGGDPAGLILHHLTNPTPSLTTHTELRASLIARHTDAAAAKEDFIAVGMVNVSLSVLPMQLLMTWMPVRFTRFRRMAATQPRSWTPECSCNAFTRHILSSDTLVISANRSKVNDLTAAGAVICMAYLPVKLSQSHSCPGASKDFR